MEKTIKKSYYVTFIPHRDQEGHLQEKIYFSKDEAIKGITKHYRNLYENEISYYLKIPKSEMIKMGNEKGCTIEPETYEKLMNWIERNPVLLNDILEFYSDMGEELDAGIYYLVNDRISDAYEIVRLLEN